MDFGITSVIGITVITYLIGMGCKAWEKLDNKFIPVICGFVGAILGIVAMKTMPDFPAKDVINAVAIGIVSGLASTGANQIGKQLSGK
jgi:hypothetical protein